MRVRLRWAASALLAVLPVGCGGDGAARPMATVTDSAGVRIVTSDPGEAVYATVAGEPSVSLGGGADEAAPELQFEALASVRRDEAGNLVVTDRTAGNIRVFAPGGQHLMTLGGTGEGPGEFSGLLDAWPAEGGSVLAYDGRLRRLTTFSADGALVGTVQLDLPQEAMPPVAHGLAGPGSVLTYILTMDIAAMMSGAGREVRNPAYVFRHGLDGSLQDTVASLMASSGVVGSASEGRIELLRIPFLRQPSAAGSPDRIALTSGETYEAVVRDLAGTVTHMARLREGPEPLTDEHLEALAVASGTSNPLSVAQAVARYKELPLPETLPAYRRLLFASGGELWAERYTVPRSDSPVRWDVFGTAGAYLGRVTVPAGFQISEVSESDVLGINTDDVTDLQSAEIRGLELVN